MSPLLALAISFNLIIIALLLLGVRRTIIRYQNRADTDRQAIKQMSMIIDFYQGRTQQVPLEIQPDLFENISRNNA